MVNSNKKAEFAGLLHKMDQLFTGFYAWLAGQYEPTGGGFYYARSSRHNDAFEPDIESTAQAFNILERSGLLPDLPLPVRRGLIGFFQNKQDRESGFFYDGNPDMRQDEVMVARAVSYATSVLQRLDAEPLYPLPADLHSLPDYMATSQTYAEWLRSVDLSNSWRGCDRLGTNAYVAGLPEVKRRDYIKQALDYFAEIQDPKTGLWGEGNLYVRISGTFKLHTFYGKFGLPMPNTGRIYKSILDCLRHEEAKDMCYIRNPINLLSYMNLSIAEDELLEILEITIRNMEKLKRPDGGFSRESGNSPSAPNVAQVKAGEYYPLMPKPVHLSEGLHEGDMNAGTQAHLIRLQCHGLVGLPYAPLKEAGTFYNRI